MNLVDISTISGAKVIYNSLYDDQDQRFLYRDIAALELSDGTFIDVSWYPQFDPTGAYTITHYSSDWKEKLQEMRTRQVSSVLEVMKLMAEGIRFPLYESRECGAETEVELVVRFPSENARTGCEGHRTKYEYA